MSLTPVETLATVHFTTPGTSLQSGAFASDPQNGDTILVYLFTEGASTETHATVTDNVSGNPNGNYTQDTSSLAANGLDKYYTFRKSNITGGASFKITVTLDGNTYMTFTASRYSANLALAVSAAGTNHGSSGTAANTSAFTTIVAAAIIVVGFSDGGTPTFAVPSGFTNIAVGGGTGAGQPGSADYKIVSSIQTSINPTWTSWVGGGGQWAAAGLAYYDLNAVVSAAITGTVTTALPANIVAGGKTVIITLTNDTWVTSGATFDAQRQNIINGLTAATSQTNGWNNQVKANQGVSGVVRTSNTVVTVTLDAEASYAITATETITVTVPSTAVAGGVAITGAPTFSISPAVGGSPWFWFGVGDSSSGWV